MGQESSQPVKEEEQPLQAGSKSDPEEPYQNLELIKEVEEQPEKLEESAGYWWKTTDKNHIMKREMPWQLYEDSAPKRQKKSKKRKRIEDVQDQGLITESLNSQPDTVASLDPTDEAILEVSPKKARKNRTSKKDRRQAEAIEKDLEEEPSFAGQLEDLQTLNHAAEVLDEEYSEAMPAEKKKKKKKKRLSSFEKTGVAPDTVATFENEVMSTYDGPSQVAENGLVAETPTASVKLKKKKKKSHRSASFGEDNYQTHEFTSPSNEPVNDAPRVKKRKHGKVNDDLRNFYEPKRETDKRDVDPKESHMDSDSLAPADLPMSNSVLSPENPSAHSRSPTPAIAGPSTSRTWSANIAEEGFEGDSVGKQIGVYRDGAPLPTNPPAKRRLPVNDSEEDDSLAKEGSIKKKSHKRTTLTPKTPVSAGQPLKWQPPVRRRSSAKKKAAGTQSSTKGDKKPILSGKMSEEELTIMANEMEKFRDMYSMTVFDQNQLVASKATKMSEELFDMLCEALPGRGRLPIMRVCRRKFHNYSARGTFTSEEDELLKEAYEQYPKSWKKIGELLNRHPEDVRDRWRNYLVCGDNQKLTSWTEDEEQTLRDVVASCVESVEELRASKQYHEKYNDKPALELVDWQTVSSMMGHTRSRLQCMTKWKTLSDRQMPGPEVDDKLDFQGNHWRVNKSKQKYKRMGDDDLLDLLNAIRASHAGREGKIPWHSLGDDEFKAKWPSMTRKIAWKRLRSTVDGNRTMMLQDLVKTLIDAIKAGENIDPVSEDELPEAEKKGKSKSKKSKKTPLSSEMVDTNDDVDESDMERHPRIRKSKGTKLIDRMARGDESIDGLDDTKSEDDLDRPTRTYGRHSQTDQSSIEVPESEAGDVPTTSDAQLEDGMSDLEASVHSVGEESNAKSGSSLPPDEGEATQSEDSDMEDIPARRPA